MHGLELILFRVIAQRNSQMRNNSPQEIKSKNKKKNDDKYQKFN